VSSLLFIFLFSNSDPSTTVYYSGSKIFFKVGSSLVQIYGDARANYGRLSISSDTILYDLDKKFLTAKGNVLFNDGSNDIKATKMTYDVDREIGDAYHAKTRAENGWFFGEKIRYFRGGVLKIRNGYYTTCELDPPHYWFYSPKMRINVDESLVAEPVVLLVQNIPVFFVPFYFQSIKRERSSGLLRPDFGTSFYGGNSVKKIGWYQTLGSHADATFYLNYYTRTGVSFYIDKIRWNFLPYSDGNIGGNYIKERTDGKERWSLLIDTKSKMPGGIKLNVDTRIESDPDYIRDYEPGEVEHLLQKEINYNLYWSDKILGTQTDIVMDHRENLATEEVYERWPSLNMTFPYLQLGLINIRSAYKFTRNENRNWASGFSANPNLNFNFSFLNIGLNLYGQSDYYENEDILVNYWKAAATVKTRIYGLSFLGIPPITKFRHVMTPSVSFTYAPDPGSYNVSPISGFYVPGAVRSFNVSLENLFQCKIGAKKYDFGSLGFSSNYLPQTDRFSPVSVYGRFWLGNILSQDYSTSYDLYSGEFGNKRINSSLRYETNFGGNPLDLYFNHSINFTATERIQQANMAVDLNPTPKWRFGISTHYDFERNKVTDTRINLTRDLHCWELMVSVNTFGDYWDYSLRLGLKDIPDLKIARETLGILMP